MAVVASTERNRFRVFDARHGEDLRMERVQLEMVAESSDEYGLLWTHLLIHKYMLAERNEAQPPATQRNAGSDLPEYRIRKSASKRSRHLVASLDAALYV